MMERIRKKRAVALTYQPKLEAAPKVVARGKGKVAEKIIELAREHNVHIHNDSDLIEVLSQLDLSDEIPSDLYKVISELLAFVYFLNNGKKRR